MATAANLNSVFLTTQMPMKHYYDLFLLKCQNFFYSGTGCWTDSEWNGFSLKTYQKLDQTEHVKGKISKWNTFGLHCYILMSHSASDNHGLFLPSKASEERWDCVQFWKFFLSFSFFLPKKLCEAANAYYLSRLICAESEISKLVRFLIIGFHRWLLRWREASHRFSLIMKGFPI